MARFRSDYAAKAPNQPIPLYEGSLQLERGGSPFETTGTLFFHWLPKPAVRFEISPVPIDSFDVLTCQIRFPNSSRSSGCQITSLLWVSGAPPSALGSLTSPIDIGTGSGMVSVEFCVANFPDFTTAREYVPADALGADWSVGDIGLELDPWRVEIQEIEREKSFKTSFKADGGYAITHLGRVTRIDGSQFNSAAVLEVLEQIRYFISFACGYWLAPILLQGRDSAGSSVWQRWAAPRMDSMRWRPSWADVRNGQCLRRCVGGFANRLRHSLWGQGFGRAVHWYIESNRGGSDIESSIVLTQATLEMIAELLFVEDQKKYQASFYNGQPAHRKIRELANWASIDTAAPSFLAQSPLKSKLGQIPDGPGLFSSVRNWIVHPTIDNQAKLSQLSGDNLREIWSLGLWYSELILLKLCDYNDVYANRRTREWAGEVEKVPWA